jgi:predicted Fe-S protein YdhL (DUF1289 family)
MAAFFIAECPASVSTAAQADRSDVPSPCRQICALDPRGICTGCLRSIEEIAEWGAATPERRREILRGISRRQAAPARRA